MSGKDDTLAEEETVAGIGTDTSKKSGPRQGRELFEYVWAKMDDIADSVRISRLITGEEVPSDLQDDTIRLVGTITYLLRYFDICSDAVAAAYFDDFISGEIAHHQLEEKKAVVNAVIKEAYDKFGGDGANVKGEELREWVEGELNRRGVETGNITLAVPGVDKSIYAE